MNKEHVRWFVQDNVEREEELVTLWGIQTQKDKHVTQQKHTRIYALIQTLLSLA